MYRDIHHIVRSLPIHRSTKYMKTHLLSKRNGLHNVISFPLETQTRIYALSLFPNIFIKIVNVARVNLLTEHLHTYNGCKCIMAAIN